MVDIFRIYAPETPYKDPEMLYVFDAIITQIRGLQTFASGSEDEKLVIYILQSLASVKSCVIPVILAQKGLEDAFETVQMLFAALIDSIRPEHSNDGKELLFLLTLF
jgi:sister-chromatid-cohesion protein PDS5